MGDFKTNTYPDKAFNVEWDVLVDGAGNGVEVGYLNNSHFIFRLNEYSDIWKLKHLVDVCNGQKVRPTITIPNLIDAQADRRFAKNQSFGLKLVIQELAAMDADFRIFHPHNPEVVEMGFELLGNPVTILDNTNYINKVINSYIIQEGDDIGNLILMSSDAGGFKPLMKLCDNIHWEGETASAAKSRKHVDGKSVLTQSVDRDDYEGKDILIIDDLSVRGGTFKGLSKLLRARNCGKLYLAVSHMTLQNLGKDHLGNYFDRVFTTDSKFDFYGYPNRDNTGLNKPKNLEILSFN